MNIPFSQPLTAPISAAQDLWRRNITSILILLCHFMTQNQKLRCSPETFRLSFYGIQGVPKKILAQLEPRFWKSVVENKIFLLDPWREDMSKAQIFFGTPWIP